MSLSKTSHFKVMHCTKSHDVVDGSAVKTMTKNNQRWGVQQRWWQTADGLDRSVAGRRVRRYNSPVSTWWNWRWASPVPNVATIVECCEFAERCRSTCPRACWHGDLTDDVMLSRQTPRSRTAICTGPTARWSGGKIVLRRGYCDRVWYF